jgi:hypothetical protein
MNRVPTNESTSTSQGATTEQEQGNKARANKTPKKMMGEGKHRENEEPENRNIVTDESGKKDTMQGKEGQTGAETENMDGHEYERIKMDREEATIETNALPSNGTPDPQMETDVITEPGTLQQDHNVSSGITPNSTYDDELMMQVKQTGNKRQKKQNTEGTGHAARQAAEI